MFYIRFIPSFHFLSGPVIVTPRHFSGTKYQTKDETKNNRHEYTKHQALESNKLQISVSYNCPEG